MVSDFKEKNDYKPEVKIKYRDDQGRDMSAKEAFRYLSHRFHGKGSGKMKTEKRQKKWEQEQVNVVFVSMIIFFFIDKNIIRFCKDVYYRE